MTENPEISGLLVLPHLRIQNANAISSPLTWGFPSITAFLGVMHALERRLSTASIRLPFVGVGVICHHFEAQASRSGYTHAFHLTRNPVDSAGDTAAIVEEGRIHLDVTLAFGVGGLDGRAVGAASAERRAEIAEHVADVVGGMRIAGGSVMPALPRRRQRTTPYLAPMPGGEANDAAFCKLRRQWLPGFALVSRDDLLASHLAQMRERQPDATLLDAWLDASRLNYRCTKLETTDSATGTTTTDVEWIAERPPGWIVPIPVGFGALSELHAPGSVAGARDRTVPFRFVESLYSLGQWVSPHRLRDTGDLLWFNTAEPDSSSYRCSNHYRGESLTAAADID